MRALLGVVVAAGFALVACGQAVSPADSAGSKTTSAEQTAPETLATPAKPADPSATKPSGTPAPPVTIGPDGPVVPAGVTQVPPAQVNASALPEHYEYRGMVWVFDDGRSLQMFASATSGCGAVDAKLLDQSADTVRVELQALDQQQGGPADGDMCTAVITPLAVTVRLDAPLGDRTVYLTEPRSLVTRAAPSLPAAPAPR